MGISCKERNMKDTVPSLELMQKSLHKICRVQDLETGRKVELPIRERLQQERVAIDDEELITRVIPNEVNRPRT